MPSQTDADETGTMSRHVATAAAAGEAGEGSSRGVKVKAQHPDRDLQPRHAASSPTPIPLDLDPIKDDIARGEGVTSTPSRPKKKQDRRRPSPSPHGAADVTTNVQRHYRLKCQCSRHVQITNKSVNAAGASRGQLSKCLSLFYLHSKRYHNLNALLLLYSSYVYKCTFSL